MSKYVKLITDDARFARMLTLELSDIGVVTAEIPENTDGSDEYYLVADLAKITEEELISYSNSATVVGFTEEEFEIDDKKVALCASVFKRPYLMSDFLSVFGGGESIKRFAPKSRLRNEKKPRVLTVDENSSSALWGDMKIPLSDNEYKLLSLLCENRGELVEREKIYSLLGAEDGNMGDVYVCHLRRKIDNKLGLKLIYTIRGKGYMLKN